MKAVVMILLSLWGVQTLAADQIIVKGLFKDKAVVQVDGKPLVLSVGKPRKGLLLISADSKQAVIEVEGEQKTLTLGTHIGGSYVKPAGGTAIRVWPTPSGMYLINGSINSFPMNFLIDTGATTVAMNSVQAKRIGLDYKLNSRVGAANTASGRVKAYYLTLKKVRIGEIELKNVPASVIEGTHPTEVLLGQSFLNRLQMRREGQMMELISK